MSLLIICYAITVYTRKYIVVIKDFISLDGKQILDYNNNISYE